MFEALAKFSVVGWDVDETLVRHPNSEAMWDFIARNPYDQTHHIVTFRTGGLQERVYSDLLAYGSDLRDTHFTALHSIPDRMYVDHKVLGVVGSLDEIRDDPYVVWKGKICAEKGIEVLIDDMTHKVIHGCNQYGVVHIHPDDL